jgi:hypothetical protein
MDKHTFDREKRRSYVADGIAALKQSYTKLKDLNVETRTATVVV